MLRYLSRLCYELLLVTLTVLLLKFAYFHLNEETSTALSGDALRRDLLSRRSYLLQEVESFSMSKMPSFIPDQFKEEWAIGTLSMTSAALTNLAFELPETREESIRAIEKMVELMLQPELRNFEKRAWGVDALDALDTDYGQIGYLGHLNFMLSALGLLGGDFRPELYQRITAALARRMEKMPSQYLETFPGVIFTADNMVVVASIANHDRIFAPAYSPLVERWVKSTREKVCEKRSGLIPFYVDAEGNGLGVPRGSGVGWNSFYLPFIDKTLADEQYALSRQHLLQKLPFGFYAFREYLPFDEGGADIDSGPVVFGLSTSGTGFGLAGVHAHADREIEAGILRTAEFVGMTVGSQERRRYLLAPLVGDAIMLAMRTARVWDSRFLKKP